MLSNGKLLIFDNFSIDRNLPKYKKKTEKNGVNSINSEINNVMLEFDSDMDMAVEGGSSWGTTRSSGIFMSSNNIVRTNTADAYGNYVYDAFFKNNWLEKYYFLVRNIFKKSKSKIETIPVERVFAEVAKNSEELSLVNKRLDGYKKILEKAKTLGQTALQEQIKDKISIFYHETILLKGNMKQYLTEEKLALFASKCERGLKLDWIKNFTRVIPDEVMLSKIEADKLEVFDNYVILHFDPNNKGTALTKEEIEKKKDPILFGVINGSTKLYFVDDWIDEICDLTWDTIADVLGEEVLEEDTIKENVQEIKDL